MEKKQHPAPKEAPRWVHDRMHLDTQFVHAGVAPDPRTGAILTPIFQSSVFVQESVENYLHKGHSYSGSGNPTVSVLEQKIAQLEKGAAALCYNSGMAAVVSTFAAFLREGDHCILSDGCYGTTQEAANEVFGRRGIRFSFVDFRSQAAVAEAVEPSTRLLFSEYPTNPTLRLTDLAALSALAKKKGIKHACDSTLASPMVVRPLEFGADLVIQSTTKYYDGHNMTIGGAVVCAHREDCDALFAYRSRFGSTMSPMTAYLTLQSSKTMHLRLRVQSTNAQTVAAFLEQHPKVARVGYPGLPSFSQKDLAASQHRSGLHGGMLYLVLQGGAAARKRFCKSLQRPWSFGANLGAVESLASCPAVMSNGNMTQTQREAIGIDPGFVRLSCGIECAQDLVNALEAALTGT